MRFAIAAIIIISPIWSVSGRDVADKTWVKSGVSYDQYRKDAVECAHIGYYRDVSRDEPAVRYVTGWRAADTALNMPGGNGDGYIAALKRTQPDRRMAEIHQRQTADVQECLVQRGYREADLDRSDVKKLRRLAKGSEARRRYLHAIATR